MKRILSTLLALLCLMTLPIAALAADSITVNLSETIAVVGDEITASGSAPADTWITLEGTDTDGNILYFSAVLSDSSGSYSQTLKVPDMDDGTLTITAGSGSITASTEISVYTLYTVTFDNNGGDTEASPTTMDVASGGTVAALPTAPTRSDYTFASWNTSSDGSGSAFTTSTAVTADITVYAQWTKNSSSDSSSTASTVTTSTSTISAYDSEDGKTAAVSITSATNSQTAATTATVTAANVTSLITAAKNSDAGLAGISVIEIIAKSTGTVKTVKVNVPSVSFKELTDATDADIKISTSLGTISLSAKSADTIGSAGSAQTLSITIFKTDSGTLSDSGQALIGSRPVYSLTITSGSTMISSFGGGKATVNIPYTLADGEDANKIVIYYISGSGELVAVPDCLYDAESGTVTFTTTHFSEFAVGYNDVSFTDVSGWYKDYVSYLAARGIIGGTGDGKFSPDANITRAQFVTILARMSGDDLTGYTSSSFSDVATTDWYFTAVQWAYKNGVAAGSDGKFNPGATITRQDIAVMLARYADKVASYTLPKTNSAVTFTDSAKISSYASDAVTAMQQAGIISGNSDGSFAPAANATRAQATKMIVVFMQKMIR